MEVTLDTIFTIIGAISTTLVTVYGYGKLAGKQQSKDDVDEVKDQLQAEKIIEFGAQLAVYKLKHEELVETVHKLEKEGALSTQKLETLEGQLNATFEAIGDLGRRIEDLFNKTYELKKG